MNIHEEPQKKTNRKTKMEVLKTIKKYIESEDPIIFNKSSMLKAPWNLDPRTVEEFLQLAYFCQNNFPRIRISFKNGKKTFQQLDYQELKREMEGLTLEPIKKAENSFNIFKPKLFPVFKCRTCGIEFGYPSHHTEPMIHKKNSRKLICAFRECNFTQQVPEHHDIRMEIFVKHTDKNSQEIDDWLNEENDY